MGMDCYKILDVNWNASDNVIKQSYMRMVKEWNPAKKHANKEEAEIKFRQISEAYEILRDHRRRVIYDTNRVEGLKRTPSLGSNCTMTLPNDSSGSSNSGDEEDIIEKFFGCDPFGLMFNRQPSSMVDPVNALRTNNECDFPRGSWQHQKAPTVMRELECSLEELYLGAIRIVEISRIIEGPYGRVLRETEKVLVNVEPGWKNGTKLTFPGKGDSLLNQLPGDVVFVVREMPHPVYKRVCNDLIVHKKIPFTDSFTGTTINLRTLDGRYLSITLSDQATLTPNGELVINNEGMPSSRVPGKMGCLRIRFKMQFPEGLTSKQRVAIRNFLEG